MKSSVAIALIIAGVVLIAIPPLSDAWVTLRVTQLMANRYTSVELSNARMEDAYRIGCMILGAAMIGVAVIASRGQSTEKQSLQVATNV